MSEDLIVPAFPSRVLICGLGSIGRRHLRVLRQYWPGIDIAVLRSGLGQDCMETDMVNHIFFDLDKALSWTPQAAIIATPAPDHLNKALRLARLEVPLLIEKPVGCGREETSDWKELIYLSKHVPVLVGYVIRHDPCLAFVKDQLRNGKLGKLIDAEFYCGSWLPDWRPNCDYRTSVSARRDKGGGVLLELSHELDVALYLLGSLNIDFSLLQQSHCLEIDVEDQAIIVARTLSGCLVTVRLNFCTLPSRRYAIIRGSDGEIHWDLIEAMVNINIKDLNSTCYTSNISADERYRVQMNHFLECVMRKASPKCSLSEGLEALQLVQKVRDKHLDFTS